MTYKLYSKIALWSGCAAFPVAIVVRYWSASEDLAAMALLLVGFPCIVMWVYDLFVE